MDWSLQVAQFLVEEIASNGFRWIGSILLVGVVSLVFGGRRWIRGEVFSGIRSFVSGGSWPWARTRCPVAFGTQASLAEISDLTGKLVGLTELAASEFLQPHLGKRLSVIGPLLEAKGEAEDVAAVTIEQPNKG